MVVRGAPAIGVTAAYGVVLAAQECYAQSRSSWKSDILEPLGLLRRSRPTAVNLFWALDRMDRVIAQLHDDPVPTLLAEARAIHEEDIVANRRMGDLGAALMEEPGCVLTHCIQDHWRPVAMARRSGLFAVPGAKGESNTSMPTKPGLGCRVRG